MFHRPSTRPGRQNVTVGFNLDFYDVVARRTPCTFGNRLSGCLHHSENESTCSQPALCSSNDANASSDENRDPCRGTIRDGSIAPAAISCSSFGMYRRWWQTPILM